MLASMLQLPAPADNADAASRSLALTFRSPLPFTVESHARRKRATHDLSPTQSKISGNALSSRRPDIDMSPAPLNVTTPYLILMPSLESDPAPANSADAIS